MRLIQNDPLREQLCAAYDQYAQERETGGMQGWKIRERADFLALLKQEQKKALLEIGAGTGRDSKFFQEQGLETVCIDLSPAMVALCKQKGLTAHRMDIGNIQFPDASFDAIYSMNSLLHLPKTELPGILRRMECILRAGGLVFIGVYGGYEHEGVWEQDRYLPHRFFSFFTDEGIQQEVGQVFDILSFRPVYYDNGPLHFQSLTLRKRTRD